MTSFQIPKNLIQREAYIARITPFIRKPVVKVITGQRRVGKSFLLFQLMKHILKEDSTANIIYINMEDLTFEDLKTASDLNKYVIAQSKEDRINYIFIDEIQEIKEFEKLSDLFCSMSRMIST